MYNMVDYISFPDDSQCGRWIPVKKALSILLAVATALLSISTLGIYLYRNQAAEPPAFSMPETRSAQAFNPDGMPLVDLNRADAAQLMTLPGIGETYAQRILEYRAEHGPFESVAELLLIEGFGSARVENILDYITIGGQHEDFGG